MTTVSHGMDVSRVREIATQVQGLATRVDAVRTRGTAQVETLESAWAGPDADALAGEWSAATPMISGAAQGLRQSATAMLRDADEQERASQAEGGWGATGITPRPATPGAASIIDRVTDVITDIAKKVADGIRLVAETIRDIMRNPAVAIPMLIKSMIQELAKRVDDVGDFFKTLPERYPKVAGVWSKAAPVLKFLGRFAKVIPGAGVVAWVVDAWGVGADIMNGELNLRDVWSKVVLGGVSAIAALFPGVGTLISIGAALEQMRFDFEPFLWGPADQLFGDSKEYQHLKRVINLLQGSFYAPAYADLLPSDPITFTPPTEMFGDVPVMYGTPGGVGSPLYYPLRDLLGLDDLLGRG
ncbi:MAG TPA: WXG100 family type VII secretion target [Candidatus Janibacter merdipullorum]|nr:WXG100 family type VII secretion target [Candidatus Janibacter merdipullorum]